MQRNFDLRVLVADGDAAVREEISNMLADWGYTAVQAADGQSAWSILRDENGPRMAILDSSVPGMEGADVCRRARTISGLNYIYVVMLARQTRSDSLALAMEAGADDCLSKPIPWAELRVRLKAGFRVIRLQERLTAARQELYEQATHDGLTGLWNRRTIVETLRYEVARSQRATTPLALIMADIDHFKRVNDVYGHLTGDRALTETARSITSALRPYDSAGRYGGEEFLIVAPGCDRAAGVALAERLRRTVAGSPIAEGAGTIKLSCSFGVAWYDGSLPLLSDHLLRSADRALYAAKRKGRNRVEIAAAPIVEADIQHLAEPCLV